MFSKLQLSFTRNHLVLYILELPSVKCISAYFYKTTCNIGLKLIIGERAQVNLVVLKA